MATCNPSDSLNKGFPGLSENQLQLVKLQLLRQWANNTQSANDLMAAAHASGFTSMTSRDLEIIQTQLLCEISTV